MSGFVLAPECDLPPRWGNALCFTPQARAQALRLGTWKGWAIGLDARFDAAPAADDAAGLRVSLIGRIYPAAADWARAHTLPGTGGALCKLLLEAWKDSPASFPDLLNGPAIALVWEERTGCLHLFTDRMGIFPVYGNTAGSPRLASHPDLLADLLASEGRPCPIDALSLAENIATGSGVPPHTFYEGIHQLEPASCYRYLGRHAPLRVEQQATWAPAPPPPERIAQHLLAEEFAAALREAAGRRSALPGPRGLLLSGGADSRALLFGAPDPSQVHTLTFCDATNPEARIAERLAQLAGAKHDRLFRTPEHYALGAEETVRITGGMWSIKDAHFCGFLPRLQDLGLGDLMTGCYTDYLYKGLAFNRRPQTFLGKNLALDRLAPYRDEYYQPHFSLAPPWQSRVQDRQRQRFGANVCGTYEQHPETIEDLRIRPLSREADAMGRLFLLRTLPWDPVMTDFALLPFVRRLAPDQKLNSRVFRQAVLRLAPPEARAIPNNNDGAPLGASECRRNARYVARTGLRKVARACGWTPAPGLATEGSWPDFGFYLARSAVLPRLWEEPTPGQRELLSELLGENPWRRSLAQWAQEGSDLILRLITLRIWLGQRGV